MTASAMVRAGVSFMVTACVTFTVMMVGAHHVGVVLKLAFDKCLYSCISIARYTSEELDSSLGKGHLSAPSDTAANKNVDIKTVQENLGHATASFTLATYAHATPGMKRESAKRMTEFIHSVQGA